MAFLALRFLNFNPLPHTRENFLFLRNDNFILRFQSTPSYEGELFAIVRISNTTKNFNPLPHTRENKSPPRCFGWLRISIHSLIRGRTLFHRITKQLDRFQSTPSYEGEHKYHTLLLIHHYISIHSLIRGRTPYVVQFLHTLQISIHSLIRGRT